jgi:hypothetical protein
VHRAGAGLHGREELEGELSRNGTLAARVVFLAALLGVAAGPARADLLVARNGTWIETRGGWQVKGKLVVFHTLKGDLSSLRLSEVDLEASRRETARAELVRRAAAEARQRPPEKKAPVFVLTDDKVRHAEPGAAGPTSSPSSPSLTVASWERAADPKDGHVVITGVLRNVSGVQATEIELSAQLLDADGKATATGQAVLTATALASGEQSGFRVEFPGASSYTEVKFEPQAVMAVPEPAPAPAADND